MCLFQSIHWLGHLHKGYQRTLCSEVPFILSKALVQSCFEEKIRIGKCRSIYLNPHFAIFCLLIYCTFGAIQHHT